MPIYPFRHKLPLIAESAYIHDSAQIIGDVTIGPESSIWPLCVLRGDVNRIEVGHHTNIQDGTICHVTHDSHFSPGGIPLLIGNDVTVGHRAVLHACTIQDLVLIGMGSIILDGVVVQSKVMIGAGSLVPPNKVLESGFLWMGSPVRKIRALTDEELGFLAYSAKAYTFFKNQY